MSHDASRRRILVVPALAALLLASGCSASVSTDKTVNTDEAEKAIAAQLLERQKVKATVTCPEDVKAKKGASFDCAVKADSGEQVNARVLQKDDEGNISWTIE